MEHELLDMYDRFNIKRGTVYKDAAHRNGTWHKSVHVWVINDNNEVLLQKRCAQKSFFPNVWDCSFAGHVGARECSIDAVLREGKEEIGIDVDLDKLDYVFTNKEVLVDGNILSREFVDVYILRQNFDLSDIQLQEEEVSDARYIKMDEFLELIHTNEILPHEIEYLLLSKLLSNK